MHASPLHYFPLAPLFFLGLMLLLALVVGLFYFNVLSYAYEKMGIGRQYVLGLLVLTLLGSSINIPIAELPPEPMYREVEVSFFGVHYLVPDVEEWPHTVLAVNLGGAIIPTVLSVYLLVRNRLWLTGLLGVIVVTLVVHWLARPVRGVGIAVPVFVPPAVAAITALVLSRRQAAPLAYVAGTLGTLIGADLLNLGAIAGLGAPVASIGGAGTFDGVFLTGIIAVLLA